MSIIHRPPVKAKDYIVPAAKAVFVPTTEESIPFNAAIRQTDPMDLSEYGYVEEEYLVSGEANVYSMGPRRGDTTYIKAENCPYTDRILVRKPENPKAFSGTVLVELMNYAFLMDNPQAGWGALHEYLLPRGDAWVGLTIRDSAITALKRFDEQRYSSLRIPNPVPTEERGTIGIAYNFKVDPDSENGLFYDITSQVGALIKSGGEDSPFKGYEVRYTYVTGASAGDLTTYAGFVHNYAKLPGGKPVYDGIQIFMTGAPANLNNEERNVLAPDPLCIIDSCVPTFRVLTLGDMLGKGGHPDWSYMQRREESNDPVYRIYETSGASLGIRTDRDTMMDRAGVEKIGGRWFEKRHNLPYHAFAMQYVLRATFDALKKYCEFGILPPKSRLLETTGNYPDVDFVLDEYGNVKGGVRSAFVDVPIASYEPNGKINPFSKEKLRELYGTHAEYVKRIAENCEKHIKEGFLLAEDAMTMIQYALEFNIDDDVFLDNMEGITGRSTYGK